MVFTETLSWGFCQFFPTGAYAGIGMCVEFKNVMKSATKKKNIRRRLSVSPLFQSFQNCVSAFEDGLVDGVPVWPIIYYCLRCGDLKAAIQVH